MTGPTVDILKNTGPTVYCTGAAAGTGEHPG